MNKKKKKKMGLTAMEKGKQLLPVETPESSSTASSSLPLLLPIGMKFTPTDTELIGYHLHKKASGKQILTGIMNRHHKDPILERDVYGCQEPLQIFQSLGKSEDDQLYVFTPLKTNFLGGKRLDPHAGNGTWKPQNTMICRDDVTDCAIGRKTTLYFLDKKAQTTPWVMHQYTLLAQQHSQPPWALCHIQCQNNIQRKRKTAVDGTAHTMPSAKRQKLASDSYASLSIRST